MPNASRSRRPSPTVPQEEGTRRSSPALVRVNGTPASAVGPLAGIPDPIPIGEFLAVPLDPPPVLIEGLLHKGSKMVISGASKSYKTWTFLDMSLSVAAGIPWWGRATVKSKVLFVNLELQEPFFQQRLYDIMEARGITPEQVEGHFYHMTLRGIKFNTATLFQKLQALTAGQGFGMIPLDPLYKLHGGRDENHASEMAELMGYIDGLALSSGAAIPFGHHFSKGNQAGRDMRDRGSGSGVIQRDADTIMTLTQHEDEDAFVVECVPRNFPPVTKFVVRRRHPLMVIDDAADPEDIRRPARAGGRQPVTSDVSVLALLEDGPLTNSEWCARAMAELGVSRATFQRRRAELLEEGAVVQDAERYSRAPRELPPARAIAARNRA